jgi:hypothetical protein
MLFYRKDFPRHFTENFQSSPVKSLNNTLQTTAFNCDLVGPGLDSQLFGSAIGPVPGRDDSIGIRMSFLGTRLRALTEADNVKA